MTDARDQAVLDAALLESHLLSRLICRWRELAVVDREIGNHAAADRAETHADALEWGGRVTLAGLL